MPTKEELLAERAYALLHRFSLERTGWRRLLFGRWYYRDEPLRNDAANILRQSGWTFLQPYHTQRVGEDR